MNVRVASGFSPELIVENESDAWECVKEKNTDQPAKYNTIGAAISLQL